MQDAILAVDSEGVSLTMSKKHSNGTVNHRTACKDAKPLPSETMRPDSLLNRRHFLAGMAGTALLTAVRPSETLAQTVDGPVNLAKVATPSSLYTSGGTKISALNDGNTPANSRDH